MSSDNRPAHTERLNLPLSLETADQLRWLAYKQAQPRSAVVAALIAAAAAQCGYPQPTHHANTNDSGSDRTHA